MKYLFYILVVINLVFLIWKFGLEERDALIEEANEQHVEITQPPPAMLENEGFEDFDSLPVQPDPAETSAESSDNAEGLPESASSQGCFEVGPIQEREVADNYLSLLEPVASEAHVVIRSGDVAEGWWVLYPKASTREAALANRQMLLNKGIYETWLFDKGPLEGAISLGLYKTQNEAQAAVQSLMEKGIAAKVAPRQVRGDIFWLKIPWTQLPLALDEAIHMLNSQDSSLNIPSPVMCR